MTSTKPKFLASVPSRLRQLAVRFLSVLATPVARSLVAVVMLLVVTYVLYVVVWRPLNHEVELPPGVSPTNPEINTEVLKEINTKRTSRTQAIPRVYFRYSPLFIPLSESKL